MMMKLYHLLQAKVPITFPPPKTDTPDGTNFNLVEDIICDVQSRFFLYLLCPETGKRAAPHILFEQ